MRKTWLILTALLMAVNTAWAGKVFTEQSVLSSGKFVKIRISQTGVYRISYSELKSMGLNPANVRVYGFGGAMLSQRLTDTHLDDLPQVPVYMNKGADGVFSEGDYILFYAQGPVSWQYTGYRFRHTRNPYSDYGYYFLTDTGKEQLLLSANNVDLDTTGCYHSSIYQNYQLHEADSINLVDMKGEAGAGREWYGETFNNNKSYRFDFRFPNIVAGSSMYCFVDVASTSVRQSSFILSTATETNELSVSAKKASNEVVAATGSAGFYFNASTSETQYINVAFSSSQEGAGAYLNFLTLTADCRLQMTDNILFVRNIENYLMDVPTVLHVSGATAETQVWNVTDLDNIYSVPTALNGNELIFLSSNRRLEQFVVINPEKYSGLSLSPFSKDVYHKSVANQNLHSLNDIDYVVITTDELLSAAQRLAAEHARVDGFNTAVVTAEQVYNEFSSGTPDATAYRMLMKMLYDRSNSSSDHRLRYLMLVGDGSFDNRKLSLYSPRPVLLTYQSVNSVDKVEAYATDDYFAFLDDNSGLSDSRDTMRIAVGRLPVRDAEETNHVVDKIIRYMENTSPGKWKTQICFLADDGDHGLHTRGADMAAEIVRDQTKDMIINKIYIDSYQQEMRASGESYPLAKSKLDNLLNNGLLFFDYSGHAGYNNITNEQMLTAKEIRQMSNPNMGFWMLATCNFAQFDALATSAAEEAVLNPAGGAVSLVASCRTVYAENNKILNNHFCSKLFEVDSLGRFNNTIGEALREAKRLTTKQLGADSNKLPYLLLGDPALRLNYPDEYKITTTLMSDTLRALTVQKVEGNIETPEGNVATDFNGKLYITVYDKQQLLTTFDNDETDTGDKKFVEFYDYPNMLFSGQTEVVNGKFSFSFMVPKDIRYNFGNGRITYYACDTIFGGEAMGHYEDMIIGGSSDIELVDTIGPELSVYLNNKSFLSGDKTNEQPRFFADIFDENGINTVGSGIGHDLLLVVDNDQKQTYILNDNFTAKAGSYQEGRVSYKMSTMSEGKHSLSFKAWDLLNNSSTATLDFEVVKGLTPEIFSLLIYPNPVTQDGVIQVVVEHDRPDAVLTTDIYIYDIAGSMVYSRSQYGTENIQISPSENHLRPGVYFFRVMIKTEDSKYASKTGKIIVLQ